MRAQYYGANLGVAKGWRNWRCLAAIFVSVYFVALGESANDQHQRSFDSLAAWQKELRQVLRDSRLVSRSTSIVIADPADQKLIFSHNARLPLVPASVMKIVTSYALLQEFGPAHRIATPVYFRPPDAAGLVTGPVVIRGSGDPSVQRKHLQELVSRMVRLGVRKIDGDLIFDSSDFDALLYPPSWKENGSRKPYYPPQGPFCYDFNRIIVDIAPNSKAGKPAWAWVEPAGPFIHLQNGVLTTARGRRDSIVVRQHMADNGHLFVTTQGVIRKTAKEWRNIQSIADPAIGFISTLVQLIGEAKIEWQGNIRKAELSGLVDSPPLAFEYRGDELAQIIAAMNKDSDNLIAEQLLKILAAGRTGEPASTAAGAARVEQYLTQNLSIPAQEVTIEDGSGLSNTNRLSSYAVNQVIMDGYSQPSFSWEFLASLAANSRDGTMKRRSFGGDERIAGWVRGKTGTVAGAINLAGIFRNRNGSWLTFSFLSNQVRVNGWEAEWWIDKFIATAMGSFPSEK